jgi:hypothetical protein
MVFHFSTYPFRLAGIATSTAYGYGREQFLRAHIKYRSWWFESQNLLFGTYFFSDSQESRPASAYGWGKGVIFVT